MRTKRRSQRTINEKRKNNDRQNRTKNKNKKKHELQSNVEAKKERQKIIKQICRKNSKDNNSKEKELNRKRMAQARQNPEFKKRENQKRLQNKRPTNYDSNEEKCKQNKIKLRKRLYVKRKRTNEEFRRNENAKTKKRMKIIRQNETYKLNERTSNAIRIKIFRQREQYVLNERIKNFARNRVLRQRIQFLEEEIANNTNRNRILLKKNLEYRCSELLTNTTRTTMLQKNVEYVQREIQKNIIRNKKLRMNKLYRINEQQQNVKRMKIARSRKKYRDTEKSRNFWRIRDKRLNTQYRKLERKRNCKTQRQKREIDVLRFRDVYYNSLIKNSNSTAKLKLQFIKYRADTPSFICCCCEGLFFKCSVVKLNEQLIIKKTGNSVLLAQINNFPSGYICNTCKNYAYRNKLYKLSTSNGLQFVEVSKEVKDLTDLEERMVAPVINFMQIRALKPYALNPQLGLKGSVVNIQIEIADMLQVLPRQFHEMHTIQVQLKRHVDHKSNYMFESIRPGIICKALKYLITTPLYEKYAIKVDEKYFQDYENYNDGKINFVVENDDITTNDETINNTKLSKEQLNMDFDQINNDEVLLVENNKEMLQGYSPIVNIIAPGQGKYPLPWHKLEELDELCFPRIFGGHAFNLPKSVTYSDRIKSEARRYDRRSCIPTRILFMAKKCLEMSCLSSINVCLRRTKKNTDGNKIYVQNALNPDFMENLFKFDDGYRILKHIRSSPAYWENKKKELLAMIRQLGKPTFFLTVSAAESHWPELIQILMQLSPNGKTISVEEAYNLDYNTKTDLIRNDPVTCARYFDYKVNKFMWLLRQNQSIFGEYVLVDSYERVEFQQRGSPHEHMLLWLKNGPKFDDESDTNDNDQMIDFIDRFLTCEYDEKNPYIKLQMHKHDYSCCKGQKNKHCRFHIPYPVMRRTMVLKPLNENEVAPKKYQLIDKLMNEILQE